MCYYEIFSGGLEGKGGGGTLQNIREQIKKQHLFMQFLK